jgi:hypothetical protein
MDRLAYGEQGVSSFSSLAPRPAPGLGALTVGGHVVPKHRRSELEQSRASLWAPANTADDWPEAVGYGQFGGSAGPVGVPEPGWGAYPQEHSWQELEEWQSWGPPAMHPDHPSAPVPRVQFSDDYPSGQMPAARASGSHDLPQRRPGGSARTWNPPRQTPDAGFGNGNRRLYAVPDNAAAGLAGPDWPEPVNFQPRQGPARREVDRFQPQPGPASQDAFGYQRQTFPGWQESSGYWPGSGPYEADRGPEGGRFRDGRSASRDSTAGQVLTLADGRAAQITQEAQDYADAVCDAAERDAAAITEQASGQAATVRDAAEREAATIRQAAAREAAAVTEQASGQAATIREAAEREAAELRARLDSMTGELGRLAAYVTENLVAPGMPATAPALPGATPVLPATRPAPDGAPTKPGTRPAGPRTAPGSAPGTRPGGPASAPGTRPGGPASAPGIRPAGPGSAPGTKPAGPASAPGTKPAGPARQTTTPTKQGDTQGRQRRAMRFATAGTAALLSVAAVGAITMTGIHGFKFFVFRESGQGETPGTFTDANFLAGQKQCYVSGVAADGTPNGSSDRIPAPCPAPQHHDSAPKGKHRKATGSH